MAAIRADAVSTVNGATVRQKQFLEGTMKLETVAAGSKSERLALTTRVGGQRVVVERLGGNPFQIEASERNLDGKKVRLEGFFVNDRLFRFTGRAPAVKLPATLAATQKALAQAKSDVKKQQDFMKTARFTAPGRKVALDALATMQAKVKALTAHLKTFDAS